MSPLRATHPPPLSPTFPMFKSTDCRCTRREFLAGTGAAVFSTSLATTASAQSTTNTTNGTNTTSSTSSSPSSSQFVAGLEPLSLEGIRSQVGRAADVSQSNGVTTIAPKPNAHPAIAVQDGEVLSNVLVDLSTPGSHLSINGSGEQWAITNIGYQGRDTWGAKENAISARVPAGGRALISNVYLGDGSVDGRQTGIFVSKRTAGTLTINAVNVQEWPDNGIYASAMGPANGGGGGTVRIVNSFSANNTTSNFRLSDGGSLENSTSVSTKPGPAKGGSSNVRGLWARDGGAPVQVTNAMFFHPREQSTITAGMPPADVSVSESALDTDLIDENGGVVSLTGVSEATEMTVPQGVPGSAQAAATGTGGVPVSVGGSTASSQSNGPVMIAVMKWAGYLATAIVAAIMLPALAFWWLIHQRKSSGEEQPPPRYRRR